MIESAKPECHMWKLSVFQLGRAAIYAKGASGSWGRTTPNHHKHWGIGNGSCANTPSRRRQTTSTLIYRPIEMKAAPFDLSWYIVSRFEYDDLILPLWPLRSTPVRLLQQFNNLTTSGPVEDEKNEVDSTVSPRSPYLKRPRMNKQTRRIESCSFPTNHNSSMTSECLGSA